MGQAENKLIEELLGQADYMATEMSLLKQRYQLAAEEADRLRGRSAWLETVLRIVAGTADLAPERLVLAVATSADGSFALGEVTLLDAETLREPFGAGRSAASSAVELFGHDLAAAKARSQELDSDRPSPPGASVSADAAEGASTTHGAEPASHRSGGPGRPASSSSAGRAGGDRDPAIAGDERQVGSPLPRGLPQPATWRS